MTHPCAEQLHLNNILTNRLVSLLVLGFFKADFFFFFVVFGLDLKHFTELNLHFSCADLVSLSVSWGQRLSRLKIKIQYAFLLPVCWHFYQTN